MLVRLDNTVSQLDAIENLIPVNGFIAVVGFNPAAAGRPLTIWLDAAAPDVLDQIDGAVEALRARGCEDIYWTPASFEFEAGVPKRRLAPLAKTVRCCYVDLDAHGNAGQYSSQRAAFRHLIDICSAHGLMPTHVVDTGRGIQAFWGFDREISASRWRSLAETFFDVLTHFGLKADSSLRNDRARIVRLPGTLNSKSGTMARVIYAHGGPVSVRALANRLRELSDTYDIKPSAPASRPDVDGTPASTGTVIDHEQNQLRLKWLLDRIPASFDGATARSFRGSREYQVENGYPLWRDVVWGAKRTGLTGAWDMVWDWAHKAERLYDDLPEALQRTWESDQESAATAIGPGTLVMLARKFCPARELASLDGFHFLDEAELAMADGDPIATADEFEDFDANGVQIVHDDPEYFDDGVQCADDDDVEPEVGSANPSRLAGDYPDDDGGNDDIAPAPLKRYGGPNGELPYGFTRDPSSPAGFCFNKKMKGAKEDDGDIVQPVRVCNVDIEFVNASVRYDQAGENGEYSYRFRRYSPLTGEPEPYVDFPAADMADNAAIARRLSAMGVSADGNEKEWTVLMARYMRGLFQMAQGDVAASEVITQMGWQKNGTCVLGSERFTATGVSPVRLSPGLEQSVAGYGARAGTLAGQRQILATYGRKGMELHQSVLALQLGAPLNAMTANPRGIVFCHSAKPGRGKSLLFAVGDSFYGNPKSKQVNGGSTPNSYDVHLIQRNSFALNIDDATGGGSRNPRRNEAWRDWILHASQGVERSRSNRDGSGLASGSGTWGTYAFISTNFSFDSLISDDGNATAAIYARALILPFDKAPVVWSHEEKVGGEQLMDAVQGNYGHIGHMFLRWVMRNKATVREELAEVSAALGERCGADFPQHRFHVSMLASGIVAARWMRAHGHIENWDYDRLEAFMSELPMLAEQNVAKLSANDPAELLNGFLKNVAQNIVVFKQGTRGPATVPDGGLRGENGVAVRVDAMNGQAWIAAQALRKYALARGASADTLIDYIREEYGSATLLSERFDMAANLGQHALGRQRCVVWAVPADAVYTPDRTAAADSGNVVPIRA